MPTFCRHNRFLERCPVCSKALPGAAGASAAPGAKRRSGGATRNGGATRSGAGRGLRIRREGRAEEDGYRSSLVPGIRAGEDARRLARELAFAAGRLLTLGAAPPGLYGEARALAELEELERATWMCFLIAYLAPLADDDGDAFSGIRAVLAQAPTLSADGPLPSLDGVALGPRSSHEQARGGETLAAYRQWIARTGGERGEQAVAFLGDPGWTPARRFERLFERLALPGFNRAARYELLVVLGRLGLYQLRADSLHLTGAGGVSGEDATTLAAKRVFGIGDPLLLDRRAAALAEAAEVPVEALDLALCNWAAEQRAAGGVDATSVDGDALERAERALGL